MADMIRSLPTFAWLLTLAFAASVLRSADAPAPATGSALSVSAERKDAMYRRGEEVRFRIALATEGKPADGVDVRWTITKDGVAPRSEGRARIEGGKAVVAGRLDEPGFLHCLVEYSLPGGSPLSARAGAAVDPRDIAPSMPVPDDFDAYWAAQKKLLAEVPLQMRMTPIKSNVPNVEAYDLQAATVSGTLSAYYARPAGAKPRSLPGIVLTHGSGVRGSRLGEAAKWAADGFIALDFNVHGLPNGQPTEFYTALSRGALKDYRVSGSDSRDTIYFRQIFLRLLRAIDAVAAQPEWDGRQMVVCGRSQGGGQAIVAAGLDPRVTYLAAEIPALCDHTGFMVDRVNGWPRFVPNEATKPDPRVREAVRYYDVVNFSTRVKCGAFVTVGFIDVVCPPTGVYAAFNQLRGPKEMWHHIETGHVARPDHEARVRLEVLAHLNPPRTR